MRPRYSDVTCGRPWSVVYPVGKSPAGVIAQADSHRNRLVSERSAHVEDDAGSGQEHGSLLAVWR